MSPLATSGLAFACILGGALLGMVVGRALPAHHSSGDSKDAVKPGLGLIATLTALVLGLLVASAKGTYDRQNGAVKEMVAKVILLNRTIGTVKVAYPKRRRDRAGRQCVTQAPTP